MRSAFELLHPVWVQRPLTSGESPRVDWETKSIVVREDPRARRSHLEQLGEVLWQGGPVPRGISWEAPSLHFRLRRLLRVAGLEEPHPRREVVEFIESVFGQLRGVRAAWGHPDTVATAAANLLMVLDENELLDGLNAVRPVWTEFAHDVASLVMVGLYAFDNAEPGRSPTPASSAAMARAMEEQGQVRYLNPEAFQLPSRGRPKRDQHGSGDGDDWRNWLPNRDWDGTVDEHEFVPWGQMIVEEPPRTVQYSPKHLGLAKRADETGIEVRQLHRAVTDGRVFRQRRRMSGGTVLIDASGSMRLTTPDLQRILHAEPTSTVAMYYGDDEVGYLVILARRGRVVAEIPHRRNGMNVIDLPALQWLGRHPGAKYWVSDGAVTGVGDGSGAENNVQAFKAVEHHRIIQVRNIGALLAHLQRR